MTNEEMIEEDPIVYYSKQELEPSYCMDEEMDNYLIWLIIKFNIFYYWIQINTFGFVRMPFQKLPC